MNKEKVFLSNGRVAWILIIAILIVDQITKVYVKTSMTIGESIHITDWFYIYFFENNGMAYGVTLINKLFLSLLRIAAITVIGWYIWQVVRQKGRLRYIVFLSMLGQLVIFLILCSMASLLQHLHLLMFQGLLTLGVAIPAF